MAEDEGEIVVTGSHGGLIGADPKRALKANARLAVFNDAGVGCDEAGITRLAVLDDRGVAAVTVAHTSAKIGDGPFQLSLRSDFPYQCHCTKGRVQNCKHLLNKRWKILTSRVFCRAEGQATQTPVASNPPSEAITWPVT